MSRIQRVLVAVSLSTISLTAVSLSTLSGRASAQPSSQTPNQSPPTQYVVKPGDFLAGIAAKVGVKLPDLLAANKLTTASLILPGQTLTVPPGGSAPVVATPGAPIAGALTHTVKPGDFLLRIASTYKVALADLLAVNKMTVQSVISPGQVLALPANAVAAPAAAAATPAAPAAPAVSDLTYTVKAGDFLGGIATKYKVKLPDLLTVNKLTPNSLILPGLKLALPAGAVAPAAAAAASVQSTPGPAGVVVAYAYAQLGKPYRFFTDGPETFDCSGLVKAAYAQIGMTLIHQSAAQATYGTLVDIWGGDTIQAGDLVFMATHGDPTVITHVGIAVDATHWIHAPKPGDVVRLAPLPAKGLITTVRRLIAD